MTVPGFQSNNVGGGGPSVGGGAPVIQTIQMMIDQASADRVGVSIAAALKKGTDPKEPVKNVGILEKAFTKLGGIMAGVFAVNKVKEFAKEMYKAGTAVQETGQMYYTVFGPDGVKQMDTFLASFRRMAGLTQQEGQRWAAQANAIGRGLGMTQQESLNMAKQVLTMAGDLSAFWNTDLEQAFNAVRGGLTGMRRPLKEYGITLYQVDVNNRALSNSHKQRVRDLTNEEKAVASLQLIQERMTVANGQLAREYNNVASAGRRASAFFRQMRDDIASRLLPGFAALFKALDANDIATQGFAYTAGTILTGAFKAVILATAGLLEAFKLYNQAVYGAAMLNISLQKTFGRLVGNDEDVKRWQQTLIDTSIAVAQLDASIAALKKGYEGLGKPIPPQQRNVPFAPLPPVSEGGDDDEKDKDRIQVLVDMMQHEKDRAAAIEELTALEKKLRKEADDTTLSMKERAQAVRDLKRIEDAFDQDRAERERFAEQELDFDNTRVQGLMDLIDLEAELNAKLEDGTLTMKERVKLQHELKQVQDSLVHGLKLLANQYGVTDEAMKDMWDGNWKAAFQSISKEAKLHALWNTAQAFEELARAWGWIGLGNFPSAAAARTSAAGHFATAAKWAALAGGAGLAGGGGGGAGGSTGTNDAASSSTDGIIDGGTQVTIYVDGIDPDNTNHQDRLYALNQQVKERYGENSSVTVQRWR